MKTVCVLGLGYIGLPTASLFATHGLRVIGVDVDSRIVQVLNGGDIHIEECGLRDLFNAAVTAGNLLIKCAPEPADVFIIAVPTPIYPDRTADMRAVLGATESIVPYLRPGNLVVLESTSPAGTTVDLVRPILERSGLRAGPDFKLVYSPERVLPGKILKEMVENARVIGGIDRVSAEAGRDLYAAFVKGEIVLTDTTTAEMVKLMENTFRDVNIALANEFALMAEKRGVNVWEAINIANRHPRVNILWPGPGVGGHCIAVDPWFLVEAAPEQARLIRQARLVNDGMPEHVAEMVQRMVRDTASVAVLGLTFKADVDDTRESPALEITKRLIRAGLDVRAFDPHVRKLPGLKNHLVTSLYQAIQGADAVVILVDHKEFKSLTPDKLTLMRGRTVVDTRNCLNPVTWHDSSFEIARLGAPLLPKEEAVGDPFFG
jgi:UDP-N-acetyl-D-mannosaminuronic acid dehydrogenase